MALRENMVYPTDFHRLTPINEPIINTVVGANLNTMDGEQQWNVLAKQKEFWKAKSCNAII